MSSAIRVLVVDDDPELRSVLAEYLPSLDSRFTVETAATVGDARTVLEAGDVDCVVGDYQLPDGTGLGLLESVREDDPALPFVLFTAHGSEDVASEAIAAGVTDYLPKGGPDRYEVLANRIDHAVAERRTEAALGEAHEKLARLHERASTLIAAADIETVYEHALGAAREILEFDTAGIYVAEDGVFVPTADSYDPPGPPPTTDQGVLGETYREGESVLVDDVAENPTAEPAEGRFRSAVSVPIGEYGVFQAIAERPGVYDEHDLELAEILFSLAEAALDRVRSERDLRKRNEQLRAILENTTAVIYIKDLEGRYTLVNDRYLEVLDLDRDDVVGKTDFDIQDFDHAETVRANDQRAIEQGEAVAVEEEAIRRGEHRWYYSVKVPLTDQDGEPTGVCGISTDITALKHREAELARQKERLDSFASVVSHDLRNPLTVARGRLEMLRNRVEDPAIESIDNAHARMQEIIEDLLTLARAGRDIGETEHVVVHGVADAAWSSIESNGATFECDCTCRIDADPSRLQQLFENLFRNAVEHGGGRVRVECLDGDGFAVVDDGPGLPERVVDALDDERTGPSGDADLGFGLRIVETVVAAHDWDLEVGADDGARFAVRVE